MLGGAFHKRKQEICWFRIVEETTEVLGETNTVLEDLNHVAMEHVRYIV